MKAKIFLCDICKNKVIGGQGDVRIKYHAKRKWFLWHEEGWERIDICASCLEKIILAREGEENE